MTDRAQLLFDENVLAVLATINEDGSPWTTPIHVIRYEDAVYWFSKDTTVHSRNIERDARVSLSLFSPDESYGPSGVYLNGRAEVVSRSEDEAIRQAFRERVTTLPPVFTEHATAYRLPIGVYSNEKSTGNCWYFYS